MKFEENYAYWVLLAVVKYSGVPWYVRASGIPTEGRTTSIHDAKRFASRDEAIEWGNHLSFNVVVRKIVECRQYTLTEEA
jgi:hypothetical protein